VFKQRTGGVASFFKANNVTWFQGNGRFEDARSFAFDKGEIGLSFKSAIVATGSYPVTPPIPGLESPRCVDSTGLLAQTAIPKRLVVLGGGIIGCEFASIFERFGTEVTIVEMLDTLIPQEDADATNELRKSFARRGIVVHLGKQCTKVEDTGAALTVHFGEGETTECDLMPVSVGRAPPVDGLGPEAAGVGFAPRAHGRPLAQPGVHHGHQLGPEAAVLGQVQAATGFGDPVVQPVEQWAQRRVGRRNVEGQGPAGAGKRQRCRVGGAEVLEDGQEAGDAVLGQRLDDPSRCGLQSGVDQGDRAVLGPDQERVDQVPGRGGDAPQPRSERCGSRHGTQRMPGGWVSRGQVLSSPRMREFFEWLGSPS